MHDLMIDMIDKQKGGERERERERRKEGKKMKFITKLILIAFK